MWHPSIEILVQSWDQSTTAAWQQPGYVASAVVQHRAGLFAVGTLVAVLIVTIFKRTMRALGLDRRLTVKGAHRVDTRSNPLRAIMRMIFPPKAESQEDRVWPGRLPGSHESSDPAHQGTLGQQLQVRRNDPRPSSATAAVLYSATATS